MRADMIDGEGHYHFKNRDSYHGHWRKGKMHGRGVYTYANETFYTVRRGRGGRQAGPGPMGGRAGRGRRIVAVPAATRMAAAREPGGDGRAPAC